MFFVFNKSKIYSYIIALCTVVILFVAAATLNDMVSPNTIETSTNAIQSNTMNIIKFNTLENNTNLDNNVIKNKYNWIKKKNLERILHIG